MWTLLVALLVMPTQVASPDIYVVANRGLTLSPKDVVELYTGDREFSGSLRLVPVDNLTARNAFLRKALAMTPQRYETLWIKKSFRDALNPPPVKATDAEVLEFVQRTRGAVGYVSKPPDGSGLAIIGKF